MSKRQKYTLYSTEGDGPKVCAFFSSLAGCKNGDKCPFKHVGEENDTSASAPSVSLATVSIRKTPVTAAHIPALTQQPSIKRRIDEALEAHFDDEEDDEDEDKPISSFVLGVSTDPPPLKGKVNFLPPPGFNILSHKEVEKTLKQLSAVTSNTKETVNSINETVQQSAPKKQKVVDTSRLLPPPAPKIITQIEKSKNIMITPHQLPQLNSQFSKEERPLLKQSMSTGEKQSKSARIVPRPAGAADPNQLIAEGSSYEEMIELVVKTQQHPRFSTDYELNCDNTWVYAKPYGDWCRDLPQVIAIDCEMCVTEDPVTGEKDPLTLIRFSAVKGFGTKDVLLDTLVLPSLPIVDTKETIHGISAEQIKSATYTLRHIQAYLLGLVSDRTVIIGHSVHNDIKTLRLAHNLVVDTSYLYSLESEKGLASIRDISEQILNQKLAEKHDSVQDAQAAYKAAVYVTKNSNPASIVRSSSNLNSLFIHKLPISCTEEILRQIVLENTHIMPSSLNPIEISGDFGKTMVQFASMRHADLAFDSFNGHVRPDSLNKMQKRVYLSFMGKRVYILVRKN